MNGGIFDGFCLRTRQAGSDINQMFWNRERIKIIPCRPGSFLPHLFEYFSWHSPYRSRFHRGRPNLSANPLVFFLEYHFAKRNTFHSYRTPLCSLGIMWLTLIVAETISFDSGIGYMAMNAREFMQMDVVVLSILLYALLGKLADLLAKMLESRCLRWRKT